MLMLRKINDKYLRSDLLLYWVTTYRVHIVNRPCLDTEETLSSSFITRYLSKFFVLQIHFLLKFAKIFKHSFQGNFSISDHVPKKWLRLSKIVHFYFEFNKTCLKVICHLKFSISPWSPSDDHTFSTNINTKFDMKFIKWEAEQSWVSW